MTIVNKAARVKRRIDVQFKAMVRLPTKGRRERGQNLTCAACGKEIEEDHFLGGFADGHPNMLLHEGCVSDEDKRRLARTP